MSSPSTLREIELSALWSDNLSNFFTLSFNSFPISCPVRARWYASSFTLSKLAVAIFSKSSSSSLEPPIALLTLSWRRFSLLWKSCSKDEITTCWGLLYPAALWLTFLCRNYRYKSWSRSSSNTLSMSWWSSSSTNSSYSGSPSPSLISCFSSLFLVILANICSELVNLESRERPPCLSKSSLTLSTGFGIFYLSILSTL